MKKPGHFLSLNSCNAINVDVQIDSSMSLNVESYHYTIVA